MDRSPGLKILMLISQLGYGGAEGSFLRLAGYLAQYADVTIALMARDYGAGSYSTAGARTELAVVILDGDRAPAGWSLGKAARWWRMRRRLQSLKAEHDMAISFLSGPNLLNALAGPRNKTIVSERGSKLHDAGVSSWRRRIWTDLLDPLTYKRSRWIVSASEGLAGEIKAANPGIAARVIAIEGTIYARQLLDNAEAPMERAFEALATFETIVAYGRFHRSRVRLLASGLCKRSSCSASGPAAIGG
jgi:hypothetical protein